MAQDRTVDELSALLWQIGQTEQGRRLAGLLIEDIMDRRVALDSGLESRAVWLAGRNEAICEIVKKLKGKNNGR